jgi:hypothetical protein
MKTRDMKRRRQNRKTSKPHQTVTEHSRDLESEVASLRTQLETERRSQIIFLSSLRREVLEFAEPIPEDVDNATLNILRQDVVKFLAKLIHVSEGRRDPQPKERPIPSPKYLDLL